MIHKPIRDKFTARSFLSKHERLFMLGLILLLFVPEMLLAAFGNMMDETFVYQSCLRLLAGQVPYLDFNTIVLPFSYQLGALWLKLFGNSLLVLRVLGVLCTVCYAAGISVWARRMGLSTPARVWAILFTAVPVYFFPYYNYTWLSLALVIWAIVLFAGEKVLSPAAVESISPMKLAMTGTLLGLAAITKQNIGIYFLAAMGLFLVWANLANFQFRQEWLIQRAKQCAAVIVGFLIPVAAEFINLGFQGALAQWRVVSGAGVSNFYAEVGNSIGTLVTLPAPVSWVAVLIHIGMGIILWFACFGRPMGKPDWPLRLIALCSLAALAIEVPLFDTIHVLTSLNFVAIGLARIWRMYSERHNAMPHEKAEPPNQAARQILCWAAPAAFLMMLLYLPISQGLSVYQGTSVISDLPHYQGIIMDRKADRDLRQMADYIRANETHGRPVVLLNMWQSMHLIPMNRFGTRFDAIVVGNFGAVDHLEVWRQLRIQPGALILTGNPYENYLYPRWLYNMVRQQAEHRGKFLGFEVWEAE
ncbi:MAG: glycosyltransferase family 39 protein [Solirubrobacterales bacterium]